MKQNFLRGSTWSSVWQSGTGKARKVSACMAIVVAGLIAGCSDDHMKSENPEEENGESGKITLQLISGTSQSGRISSIANPRALRKSDRLTYVATIKAPQVATDNNWSATAVAIDQAGQKAYITWHSDKQATTAAKVWGGAVDVVDIANQDKPELLNTAVSDSMKFNHVLLSDNQLFLAATHARTSGAIARVPLTGGNVVNEEAEYIGFPGVSVNAVAPYNGELIAVSGHSMGAYATFAADVKAGPYYYGPNADKMKAQQEAIRILLPDAANKTLSEDELEEALKDFGGKYVTTDEEDGTVYVLYNVPGKTAKIVNAANGTVVFELDTELKSNDKYAETYDYNTGDWIMVGDKKDYYGKHVFAVRNGVAYVACGLNGLHVYNLKSNASPVWYNNTQAIGVYADEEYLYASTGAGLRVYSIKEDGSLLLYAFEVETYDGTTGLPTSTKAAKTGTAERHSPNFVTVNKGENSTYIYVAYGQSGVRVYKFTEEAVDEPESNDDWIDIGDPNIVWAKENLAGYYAWGEIFHAASGANPWETFEADGPEVSFTYNGTTVTNNDDYYALDNTNGKYEYTHANYRYFDNTAKLTKYQLKATDSPSKHESEDGLLVLVPTDDAATMRLGNGWRMPTLEEWQNLIKLGESLDEDAEGMTIYFENGNTLRLPKTGYYDMAYDGDFRDKDGYYYWSSTLADRLIGSQSINRDHNAWGGHLTPGITCDRYGCGGLFSLEALAQTIDFYYGFMVNSVSRADGKKIRPVKDKNLLPEFQGK